jgi:hypothetical protein
VPGQGKEGLTRTAMRVLSPLSIKEGFEFLWIDNLATWEKRREVRSKGIHNGGGGGLKTIKHDAWLHGGHG